MRVHAFMERVEKTISAVPTALDMSLIPYPKAYCCNDMVVLHELEL